MFYELNIEEHIRVPPTKFGDNIQESVLNSLIESFEGYVSEELGFVIGISSVEGVGEGIILEGDGAIYYKTNFTMITFKPDIQEVVIGRISDITDFGAFMEIGPIDGMIHIGQTMDDYVSFSKDKSLLGKETKRSLKVGDKCRSRVIAG